MLSLAYIMVTEFLLVYIFLPYFPIQAILNTIYKAIEIIIINVAIQSNINPVVVSKGFWMDNQHAELIDL